MTQSTLQSTVAEGGEASSTQQPIPQRRKLSVRQRLARDKVMLLLCVPGLLYFVVFHYVPLFGYVVAFQEYRPFLGIGGSAFVGFDNFVSMLTDDAFWSALGNTLTITLLQTVLFFPAPILLALLLNSIIGSRLRRFVQSVVYLPHFIGWVIIVSIATEVLGGTGPVASLLSAFGVENVNVMHNPDIFPLLITLQTIWKGAGWGTIIYLAALTSIDNELYEAAAVDGALKWRRLWHITLPGIIPVTLLLLILHLGNILSVGFEQILLQRDNVGAAAGEVLDTYVYFHGVINGEWGTSAAVGLVKGLFGTILILTANKVAHLFGQDGIYRS